MASNMELETAVDTEAERLGALARSYHAKMRSDAASTDSLSESVVVPTLRDAIVNGMLAPGNRLSEVQLARQLNVSRTPMREAFAQLEREGLVTVVARLGAFVRAVTPRDVDEIYTVRVALESLAVELAARKINPLGRAQLDEVVETMRVCVDNDDPGAYVEELDRFYAVLMALADNTTLQHTHAGLLGPVRRLRRIAMARNGRMRASFEQTVKIKRAIVDGDPAVVTLMRQQLDGACRAAKEVLSNAEA